MANSEYDVLSIKIEADSSEAKTSIAQLSASLRKLNEKVEDLNTERLKEVKTLLQGIAK